MTKECCNCKFEDLFITEYPCYACTRPERTDRWEAKEDDTQV